jgi:copper chaperone CopZ
MKKNYELNGMSCGGCVNSVKHVLLQLPDITAADVQLNPQRVVLTMSKSIDVSELQNQLNKAGHYTIKEIAEV